MRKPMSVLSVVILSLLLLASCAESKTEKTEPTPEPTTATLQAQPLHYDKAITQATQEPPAPERYTDREIEMLARLVFGEASVCSPDEQRLIVWTVFQRVDDDTHPDTIEEVITQPSQFKGYDAEHPIDEDIKALCITEITAWLDGAEPPTLAPYAISAPYYFFEGDGSHNWFREAF
jgi:hypothetical protein